MCIVHTPNYSEVGIAVSPILTCSAVPVTCEHIDCYYCTTRVLVLYAFQNLLRDDLIRLHAFSPSVQLYQCKDKQCSFLLCPPSSSSQNIQHTIRVMTEYCTKIRKPDAT